MFLATAFDTGDHDILGVLNGMKELTLEADVITQNLTEACLLADIPEDALLHCRTNTDLLKLAEDVAQRLQKKVQ